MKLSSFALFLGMLFVATLIATPILGPTLADLFASNDPFVKVNETATTVTYKLAYYSDDQNIYALYTVPKSAQKVPAFVIFPAASITKESEQAHLGTELNRLGYATFVIDARGQGETGGEVPSLTSDFFMYKGGGYPTQFMMVDDLFRAYEIVSSRSEIDASRIYVAGESMGGRYAAIAAALQQNFTGALIISSGPYDFDEENQEPDIAAYMRAINPINYMSSISGKVAFIHGLNDTTIPIEEGRKLFDAATEPKRFFGVEGGHSFESLNKSVIDEVIAWFES